MIFKINPSFVPRPRLLAPPARLSFYRADMESYEFYSIISSLAAVCERAVILARTKEGRRMPRGKEGVGKGGGGSSFCLRHRRAFHFESSITVGDQSQLNSSCEDARSEKNKRGKGEGERKKERKGNRGGEEDESRRKTFRIGWVANDFKHPPSLVGGIIDRWRCLGGKFLFDAIFLVDNNRIGINIFLSIKILLFIPRDTNNRPITISNSRKPYFKYN